MAKRLTQEEVSNRIKEKFVQNVELISEYKSKRDPITLRCNDCGHIWETTTQNIFYSGSWNKAEGKHYCPKCFKTGKDIPCSVCGTITYHTKTDIERNISGYFYCSTKCACIGKNQIKKESGVWDNAKTSYRKRALKAQGEKCAICGWDEDVDVLEVHHIDENRNNNYLDNLLVLCPICHKKLTTHKYKLQDKQLIKVE